MRDTAVVRNALIERPEEGHFDEVGALMSAQDVAPITRAALPNLGMPSAEGAPSLRERAHLIDVPALEASNERLESVLSDLQAAANRPTHFPNLGWEAIKAALAKERQVNEALNRHIDAADRHQNSIDLLLDLNSSLNAHKEGEPMSEEIKKLLGQLKEAGIDLWKFEDPSLPKERMESLKTLITAQTDKERSKVQMIFTTQLKRLMDSISAIMDAVKNMIKDQKRLVDVVNNASGHR